MAGKAQRSQPPPNLAVQERLVELAFVRLADQASDIRDVTTQALAGLGVAIALATALLAIRAQATNDVLRALPGLRDLWWVPLIPFAISAALFLYASVIRGRIDLPDPERIAGYVRGEDVERGMMLFLAALVTTYEDQGRLARPQAVTAQIGVGVLAIALIACLLTFMGVR